MLQILSDRFGLCRVHMSLHKFPFYYRLLQWILIMCEEMCKCQISQHKHILQFQFVFFPYRGEDVIRWLCIPWYSVQVRILRGFSMEWSQNQVRGLGEHDGWTDIIFISN